jgi:diguanylate cyclase (GGDEF)-like protein
MTQDDPRQTMALSAAAIFTGAAFVSLFESALPGGEEFSILPGIAALTLSAVTLLAGPRLPRTLLGLLGPLGAALIGYALATTPGYTDAAVLYMWPALWMAFFFGTRGTLSIVAWIGVVHGAVLLSLPPETRDLDRWIDVVVAVLVVALVVRALAARNERLLARLTAEARVDPLTSLLNRRGLEERMEEEVSRASRDRGSLGVAVFDLDHFKHVNDEHGHEIGDRVLAWFGSLLAEQVRGVDVAARVGGEEFLVLLPRADASAAYAIAERVRGAVQTTGSQSSRLRYGVPSTLRLTISAGVSSGAAPTDVRGLIEAADRAMYSAKRTGRDRTVVDSNEPGATAGLAPVAAT